MASITKKIAERLAAGIKRYQPILSDARSLGKAEADTVTIEDLGSANGTFVNGQKIRKAQVEDRDRIAFADHEFKVRIAPPKADE